MGLFTGIGIGTIIGMAATKAGRAKIKDATIVVYKKGAKVAQEAIKKGQKIVDEIAEKIAEQEEIREEAKRIVEERKAKKAEKLKKNEESPDQIEEK